MVFSGCMNSLGNECDNAYFAICIPRTESGTELLIDFAGQVF